MHLVSYADTDAGGVLHHAKYIELAERGYHGWLKRRNMSFRTLGRDHGVSLVVYDVAARYKSAVHLEDELKIVTKLKAIDRKGLDWDTQIINGETLSFSMRTRMACLDSATKTIISVPDFLISRFGRDIDVAEEA